MRLSKLVKPGRLLRLSTLVLSALLVALSFLATGPVSAAPIRSGYNGGLTIFVHVPDSSQPLGGATVQVAGVNRQGRTGADGKVAFPGLALRGAYQQIEIKVTLDGYRPWTLKNEYLRTGDTLNIDAPVSVGSTAQPEVITAPTPRWLDPAPQSAPQMAQSRLAPRYYSDSTPPSTIRVYRTNLGRVDTVDFKSYVKHVLPNEWISSWGAESLKAGAMAAKTYGWYWVNHQKYSGPYDVVDSTGDQVYDPNSSTSATDNAVEATWGWRMTRSGAIFQAQYCAGYAGDGSRSDNQCGQTAGSFMSQYGSQYWAQQGKTWDWILHYYYDNIVLTNSGSTGGGGGTGTTRNWPLVQNGNTGENVYTVQLLLKYRGYSLTADGSFGPATQSAVQQFQSAHGLSADGVVGNQTWEALVVQTQQGDSGYQVQAVQRQLNAHGASVSVDGSFGPGTNSAVISFQSSHGLTADGVVGSNTWCKLVNGTIS